MIQCPYLNNHDGGVSALVRYGGAVDASVTAVYGRREVSIPSEARLMLVEVFVVVWDVLFRRPEKVLSVER